MNIIDEFVRLALEKKDGEQFFIPTYKRRGERQEIAETNYFMQVSFGKARFIYGETLYGAMKFPDSSDKPSLIAVVANDTVYAINEYRLFGNAAKEYPQHSTKIEKYAAELKDRVGKLYFPKFWDALEVPDEVFQAISTRNHEWERTARKRVILGKEPKHYDMTITHKDIFGLLCGFEDEEALAARLFEADRREHLVSKAIGIKVEEYAAKPDLVKPYERTMALALVGCDAKTVTVEFEHNGRRAADKMDVERLKRAVIGGDSISENMFATSSGGERLHEALGIGMDDEPQTSADITKITFSRKTLYEREDMRAR